MLYTEHTEDEIKWHIDLAGVMLDNSHFHICPFCPTEDLSGDEEVFPKEIAKWNSNDLMDKIESADAEDTPGMERSAVCVVWWEM